MSVPEGHNLEFDGGEEMMPVFDPVRTPYAIDEAEFTRAGTWRERYAVLVRYAVLAPSSHNCQPWKFRITPSGIGLYADYTRRLRVVDPENRELIMSVGAALFNLRVAAAHFGLRAEVSFNFSGDSEQPLAFVGLDTAGAPSADERMVAALFSVLARRHTNRHPFLAARVPRSVVSHLTSLSEGPEAGLYASTEARTNTAVAAIVAKAEAQEYGDPAFRREHADWARTNSSRKTDGVPGYAIGLSDLSASIGPWATRAFNLGKVVAEKDRVLCIEAPCLAVIHSEDAVPAWIESGQLLERVLLEITQIGLQFSFFNMAIEVPDYRLELRRTLSLPAWPQLLLRIGHSLTETLPTPRRPVEEMIIDAQE